MSAFPVRPSRRLRSELLPLVVVGSACVAVVCLFPREAFSFERPVRNGSAARLQAAAGCAFVTLTPEQETAALAAARTSWQSDTATPRARIEMLPAELPDCPFAPALDLASRPSVSVPFRAAPQAEILPPTVAAPRPPRLPAVEAEKPRLAFPRESLLELNR